MSAGVTDEPVSTRTERALTIVEVLIILASIAILIAFLLPTVSNRPISSRLGCANNLKQMGLSFRTWAIDNDNRFPMRVSVTNGGTMELTSGGLVFPHFQVMSNELSTPRILVCPDDQQRTNDTSFGRGFSDQSISYFLNVDAIPDNGSSLLCGDRNLTNQRSAGSRFVSVSNGIAIGWTREIHSKRGNLCFGDGLAELDPVRNGSPRSIVKLPEGVTNRLAIP